jgi:hypothetical protein
VESGSRSRLCSPIYHSTLTPYFVSKVDGCVFRGNESGMHATPTHRTQSCTFLMSFKVHRSVGEDTLSKPNLIITNPTCTQRRLIKSSRILDRCIHAGALAIHANYAFIASSEYIFYYAVLSIPVHHDSSPGSLLLIITDSHLVSAHE